MKLQDIESHLNICLYGGHVIKFDAHPYFQKFSGSAHKGVDYLIINDDYLFLIEIKNYQGARTSYCPIKTSINRQFYQKCEDTLSLFDQFEQFIHNNWFRRYVIFQWGWFFLGNREWYFWAKALHLYKKNQVICLLHVE